jgi:signal peptidase I
MAVYAETGRVGGGRSPAHVAVPVSWTSRDRTLPLRLHAPRLSPNTRSALQTTARVAGVVRWVLLIIATLIMGGVTIASLLGFRVMIVTSGSMLPTFGPGDAVVVRPGGVGDIGAGDVITFRAPGAHGMTTHRVISVRVINGTRWFQTKGDANPTTDPNLVPADAVYGSQKLALPNLGRFLYLALTPKGKLILLGLPISFLAAQEMAFLLRERRRRQQRRPPDLQEAGAVPPPEEDDESEVTEQRPEPVVLIDIARSESSSDLYVQLEEELRAESAHLAVAEDALAELERKVAELSADNGHVGASDVLPTTRGLELQVALSG